MPNHPTTHVRPVALLALFFSLAAITTTQFLNWRDWNFDDGLIVYRIVQNLAEHGIWAYNLGETHNASTSALNTIFIWLSTFLLPATPIPILAHLSQSLWLALGAMATFLLLRNQGALWAALAGLTQIVFLASNATWGLEGHLFFALFLWSLVLPPGSLARWGLVGLLILTRPDGAILAILLYLSEILKSKRLALTPILLVALITLPWLLFSARTFGEIFPDTLGSKIWQGNSGLWGPGHVFVRGFFSHYREMQLWQQLWLACGLLGFPILLCSKNRLAPLPAYAIIQQFCYAILNVPGYHWYFISFDLALFLSAWHLVAILASRLPVYPTWASSAPLTSLVSLLYAGYVLTTLQPGRNIDPRDSAYRSAITNLNIPYTPGDTLATLEVGTIGYHLPHHIIDLAGLASANPEYLSGKNSDHFLEHLPNYLLLHNPLWHFERAISDDPRFPLIFDATRSTAPGSFGLTLYTRKEAVPLSSAAELTKLLTSRYPQAVLSPEILPHSSPIDSEFLCILDQINGRMKSSEIVALTYRLLAVRGWAADKKYSSVSPLPRLLLRSETAVFSFALTRFERPDIVTHLSSEAFRMAGYEGTAAVTELPKGTYELLLAEPRDLTWRICGTGQRVMVE